jgi:DUF177 domain-containing protein
MKLRIDDVTAESRELRFEEPEREINRVLSSGRDLYQLVAPAELDVSYYRSGSEIFIGGTLAIEIEASCARCAEDFEESRNRSFRYVLAPKSMGYDEEDGTNSGDLELSVYDGDQIDLAPLVREQILLALAERPLCTEDCQGLCPHCGANLNQTKCDCRTDIGESRLAVLRTLKSGRA